LLGWDCGESGEWAAAAKIAKKSLVYSLQSSVQYKPQAPFSENAAKAAMATGDFGLNLPPNF
jgi:hypothetical protein